MNFSLRYLKFPSWFIVSITISVFIFSVAGCSANQQVSQVSPQTPPVPSYKFFSHSKSKVFNAIEKALYNRGYVITLRDDNAGVITAEQYSTTPLHEDQEQVQSSGPSAGEVILVILGIIFIVGIIFIIADAMSSSDNSAKEKESHHENDRNEQYEHHDDNKTIGYKYILNIHATSVNDSTSKVELHMTKVIIENGTPTVSAAIKSSASQKIFFESLENELYFVQ